MSRRHHLLVSASAALVTSVLVAGCSDNKQATPRVTFDSLVNPGKNPPQGCPEKADWLTIGSFGNPSRGHTDPNDPNSPLVEPVHPVDDGGEDQQGTVGISCSVVENNGAFDVKLHAELSGATGGAVTITGLVNKNAPSPGISGNFSASNRGTYNSTGTGCDVTFDTTVGQGVAPGRIWGTITCPIVEQQSQQRVCAASAQFRFENCTQ